jgi:hypothetical protein
MLDLMPAEAAINATTALLLPPTRQISRSPSSNGCAA